MLSIRQTTLSDLPRLLEIFDEAREIMRSDGNLTQWPVGYPKLETIKNDIEQGHSYCLIESELLNDGERKDNEIVGTFALIPGVEPTYAEIFDGAWLDDTLPYATIHRIASTRSSHGVFAAALSFASAHHSNLRIDTHEDNRIMRHLITAAGFHYCGIIHLTNGSPRLAFQRLD